MHAHSFKSVCSRSTLILFEFIACKDDTVSKIPSSSALLQQLLRAIYDLQQIWYCNKNWVLVYRFTWKRRYDRRMQTIEVSTRVAELEPESDSQQHWESESDFLSDSDSGSPI